MRVAVAIARRSASANRSAASGWKPARTADAAAERVLAPTIARGCFTQLLLGAFVPAAVLVGRILFGVFDHLGADRARNIEAQFVGQRERIADHVGQFLADFGKFRWLIGQPARV